MLNISGLSKTYNHRPDDRNVLGTSQMAAVETLTDKKSHPIFTLHHKVL